MMGIMVPETCWASNKICNKNHLLHLVGILFPHINDDARSNSLQIYLSMSHSLFSRLPIIRHISFSQGKFLWIFETVTVQCSAKLFQSPARRYSWTKERFIKFRSFFQNRVIFCLKIRLVWAAPRAPRECSYEIREYKHVSVCEYAYVWLCN
jgi:hypothetical protein